MCDLGVSNILKTYPTQRNIHKPTQRGLNPLNGVYLVRDVRWPFQTT